MEHETFSVIDIPGCIRWGRQPGEPTLPVKFIQLLLPPQMSVSAVTVTGMPMELLFPGKDLRKERPSPTQTPVPSTTNIQPDFLINEDIYSSEDLYPANPYSEYHIGYSHGYMIFDMALQPVQLIPSQGRVFFYPELTVEVYLIKNDDTNPFFRGVPEEEAWVQSLVSNPEITKKYRDQPTFEYPGGLCDPSEHYEYVIITTEQNSLDGWDTNEYTPYNWESLIQKHTSEGLSCTLVTTQAINACADYYNTTPLFNDTQAHIREFCRDAYQDWKTSYVLIGADAEFIPARLMDYAYENDVDSDLYWSNLDNTFNADYDSYWGEEGDSGFDVYSELFLGRIPCDIPKDVSNWLAKSFSYTDSIDADYLENGGFFAANSSGWPGVTESDDLIDFAAIKGTDGWLGPDPGQGGPWPSWLGFLYGFETWNQAHPDNAFNLSVCWTYCDPNPGWNQGDAVEEFRKAINNDTVTLITGVGHGGPEMVLDVFTFEWENAYHNTMPFFICDLGCHSGDIDDSDDGVLGTMLFSSDISLAFGCLFNTGFSWVNAYNTNSSVALQTKLFWDYFLDMTNNSESEQNWQLGKGLAWSKDIMAPMLTWDSTWRAILQNRLLFADPAQRLKPPKQNHPPETPTIHWSPDDGLTMSTTDPEGDDVFYQIDWGDGTITEWLGPSASGKEITVMHTWGTSGTYTVRVRAKDIFNATSEWTDPLLVEIQNPELTIDSISGVFGITMIIKNTGNETATIIGWNITMNGGCILMGKARQGYISSLPVGEEKTVHSFIFGLGKTTITGKAFCAQGATTEKTARALVLGVFVLGLA